MKKESITQNQAISIVALFVIGSSYVLGIGRESRQDAWIAALIAAALAIPVLYVYGRVFSNYPGMNLFDICLDLFGKVFGRIIVILYIWYAIHLGSLVMRNYSEYMQVRVFPQMPQTISLLMLAVVSIWAVRRGIEGMGRVAMILLPFVLIVFVIILSFLVKDMRPANLLPIGENLGQVPKDAFVDFSFPYMETVLFLGLIPAVKERKKAARAWVYGAMIGGGLLFIALVRNLLVLGVPMHDDKNFPTYDSASIIIVGSFISRIENIIGANLTITVFFKAGVCLLVASIGTAKLFNVEDYRPYVAPLGLVMVAFASIVYKNFMEMIDFVAVYPYYAFPFEVILPLLLCAAAEIKLIAKRKKERGGEAPAPAKT